MTSYPQHIAADTKLCGPAIRGMDSPGPRYVQGGLWSHYCCGNTGEDLAVEPARFEELPTRWPELAERMGMPGQALPHVNGAAAEVEWTREAIDLVAELCREDIPLPA